MRGARSAEPFTVKGSKDPGEAGTGATSPDESGIVGLYPRT